MTQTDIERSTRKSILLRSSFCHPRLDASLNLFGFGVIASGLCAQAVDSSSVANLASYFQT
jgi:hypothetical protein